MTTNDGHLRTTHIGSLPRPPELLELLKKRQDGEVVDAEEWETTVANATRDIVERQADIGLDSINNGEQSRVYSLDITVGGDSGASGQHTLTAYGEVRRNGRIAPGTYSDMVVVTVNF